MVWTKEDIHNLCSFVDDNGKLDSVGAELFFKKSRKSIGAMYFSNKDYIERYISKRKFDNQQYKWNKRKIFKNKSLEKNIKLTGIRYNKEFSIFVSINEVETKIEKYSKLGVVLKQVK